MILLRGQKRKIHFDILIAEHLPSDIEMYKYVEPFAGTFAIGNYLTVEPAVKVYNDLKIYDFPIEADIIEHLDFERCINLHDSEKTVFYLDPPYYGKENVYGLPLKDKDFHNRLKNTLDDIKGVFILSYEDCVFIRSLYSSDTYKIITYEGDKKYLNKEITIIKK
jgi:site-specific DNA-adenine methylase